MNTKIIYNRWSVLDHYRTFLVTLLLLMALQLSYGQGTRIVSGTVYDSDNQPLVGATIIEQGTTNGTTADFDGNFSIQLPETTVVLEISFIGFKTSMLTVGQDDTDHIEVTLESDMLSLDAVELVAVGYGTMRKSDLTGSISTVTSEDLAKGTLSSTEQVLQGKVAGLTVVQGTGDPSSGASLRLRGGTSLTASNNPLIVIDGIPGVDINQVQPDDIASIDILKDASATAIYGSRGANGVIIITTKSQSAGFSVSYSGLSGVSFASNHLDMLSANQWRRYVRDNAVQGAIDYGATTDWQEELERLAFRKSHTISLSASGEQSGLRSSIHYMENEGLVKTTSLERLSANINVHQFTLDKKLRFDIGLFATMDKWHPLDYRIFERAFNLNPTIPVYDDNGAFTEVAGTLYENPLEILTHRTADDKRNRLLGYFKTEMDFTTDLKGVVNLSIENNQRTGNIYKPSTAVLEGRTEGGYGQKVYEEYTNMQIEAYLTYTKEIGDHRLNLMGGYSFLENTYEGFGAQRSGFETDLFGYNNLGAGQDYRLGDVYSYKGKSNLVSFYARANYSYDNRYMLTATIREDGSSRFGEDNKWGFFPSASLAWNLSNENFMDGTENWLNQLKFRVGYGVTGNQDGIGEYKSLSILGVGQDSYYDPATDSWKQAYAPTQNPNPDLKWESTEQLNVGVDFGLFSRISGSIEWYQKTTKDLLYTYQVPQPPYLVGTMLANVGELSNTGIELTLNAHVLSTDRFSWDANLTLASNKQKIEKLSNQVYETDVIYSGSLHGLSGMSNQFSQIIKEGYPVGTFWGYQSSGLDENGAFILSEEKTDIGDIQPDLTLGFGMNFTYSNFDLSFSTYGMFGQKVLNATNMMLYDPNRLPAYNVPDDFLNSGITSDPTFSSYWVEDASFLRLQNLSVGYTIPMDKVFSNFRVYLMGENLMTFTSYDGVDPEVNMSGLANPGIDRFNNYPRPTTISFGLDITFKN